MAQGARYRPNTGCAKVSFDQSLSSISQFRCCVQGLHGLAQVALVYLDVSKTFCFPGITSGTVSPGPISKYPGRAPQRRPSVASPSGLGLFARHGSFSSRDFLSLAHMRACVAAFFIWTHSQQEMWVFHAPRVCLLQEF